jgi:hypothetical protein
MQEKDSSSAREARRRFLASCGKFAAVTPPTITLMLAAAERSYVAAQSGGDVTIGGPGGVGGNSAVASGGLGGAGGTPDPRRGFQGLTGE